MRFNKVTFSSIDSFFVTQNQQKGSGRCILVISSAYFDITIGIQNPFVQTSENENSTFQGGGGKSVLLDYNAAAWVFSASYADSKMQTPFVFGRQSYVSICRSFHYAATGTQAPAQMSYFTESAIMLLEQETSLELTCSGRRSGHRMDHLPELSYLEGNA